MGGGFRHLRSGEMSRVSQHYFCVAGNARLAFEDVGGEGYAVCLGSARAFRRPARTLYGLDGVGTEIIMTLRKKAWS
jgi:hypothetical protein